MPSDRDNAPLMPSTQDEDGRNEALVARIQSKTLHHISTTLQDLSRVSMGSFSEAAEVVREMVGTEDDGWQPIETAPRDGTEFDAWDAKEEVRTLCRWGKHNHVPMYGWIRQIELFGEEVDGFDPTHWRPLPPPPRHNPEAGSTQDGGDQR